MTNEELKQSVEMREVVQQYGIKINRNGFCCCPFHQEKTASMKIYKDSYFCFGCQESGDIFSFVQHMEGVDFKTAFLRLGGTYEDGTDYQRGFRNYRLKKRKETALVKSAARERERANVSKEIAEQKKIKDAATVFSDEWCGAANNLEYLFYKLDYLTEKR